MDNFEKHIREHKDLFDEHKADRSKLWAHIEKELADSKPKAFPFWKSPVFRAAASIVLVLGLAALIGISGFGGNDSDQQDSFVSRELQDLDMYYGNLVQHQVQLVENHPNLSEEDKEQFLSFMDELDVEYETLRLEMGKKFGK